MIPQAGGVTRTIVDGVELILASGRSFSTFIGETACLLAGMNAFVLINQTDQRVPSKSSP